MPEDVTRGPGTDAEGQVGRSTKGTREFLGLMGTDTLVALIVATFSWVRPHVKIEQTICLKKLFVEYN